MFALFRSCAINRHFQSMRQSVRQTDIQSVSHENPNIDSNNLINTMTIFDELLIECNLCMCSFGIFAFRNFAIHKRNNAKIVTHQQILLGHDSGIHIACTSIRLYIGACFVAKSGPNELYV